MSSGNPGGEDINREHDLKLRDEIIESQKLQGEFLKYKLLAVGGIASLWLTQFDPTPDKDAPRLLFPLPTEKQVPIAFYLPCLIPLLLAYIDANSIHLTMRITAIGAYLRSRGVLWEREAFRGRDKESGGFWQTWLSLVGASPFHLEQMSIFGVSYVINSLVAVFGFLAFWSFTDRRALCFFFCGAAGIYVLSKINAHSRRTIRGLSAPLPTVTPPQPDPRLAAKIDGFVGTFPDAASLAALRDARDLLVAERALEFRPFPNGLYSAAAVTAANRYTGYGAVWVRDNVLVAYAHYRTGDVAAAARTIETLREYFHKHRSRFDAVIGNPYLANDPMNRPHVRFNGMTLGEIPQKWSHAQNDALGYFLWLYCKMARAGDIPSLEGDRLALAGRFVGYFAAIRYWQDADNGHWEEVRKVEASSIGIALAGLLELKTLLAARTGGQPDWASRIDGLIAQGTSALGAILPNECVSADPKLNRVADAALLFLLYPTGVIRAVFAADVAERYERAILRNVAEQLRGDFGVRRYVGDSFWCKDYRRKFAQSDRTRDFSDDMSARDKELEKGTEAQWCIFDPIISAYYGERFARTRDEDDRRHQFEHLYRSLGQVTGPGSPAGPFKCPELYFEEDGQVQPNDATPLLWTQANLMVALKLMEENM